MILDDPELVDDYYLDLVRSVSVSTCGKLESTLAKLGRTRFKDHPTRCTKSGSSSLDIVGHTQEVCGLKWNDEGGTLASGGNENLICLWDASMSRRRTNNDTDYNNNNQRGNHSNVNLSNIGPRLALTQHKAAANALAWCPARYRRPHH